jgi:hypothetical protein
MNAIETLDRGRTAAPSVEGVPLRYFAIMVIPEA